MLGAALHSCPVRCCGLTGYSMDTPCMTPRISISHSKPESRSHGSRQTHICGEDIERGRDKLHLDGTILCALLLCCPHCFLRASTVYCHSVRVAS